MQPQMASAKGAKGAFYISLGRSPISVNLSWHQRPCLREIDAVQKYIQAQEQHHRKRTFQEEYLEILHQYQVDYDERYLWT